MAQLQVIVAGSTTLVRLRNLRRADGTKPLVTGATVTARILDAGTLNELVAPFPLNEVSGSSGLYEGIVDSDDVPANGTDVLVEVTVDAGGPSATRIFTVPKTVGVAP